MALGRAVFEVPEAFRTLEMGFFTLGRPVFEVPEASRTSKSEFYPIIISFGVRQRPNLRFITGMGYSYKEMAISYNKPRFPLMGQVNTPEK
jgi:hypothetical protein